MAITNEIGSSNRKRPFYRKRTSTTSTSDGNSSTPTKTAVRDMRFHMHDSAQRKTSESFGKVKEAIVLKIQKTFDDPIAVAQSIADNTKTIFKKTEIQKSVSDDPATKVMENMIFLEEFKIDFTIYRQECKRFDETWVKAYALIWDTYCSKDIQRNIKEMPAYETVIKNNPLELLRIVETLMHTPEKAKYPTLTLIEVLLSFLKIKQGDNEDLYDYLSRFKTERDIVMRLAGNNLIDGYIMGLPEYLSATTDAERKQVKNTELQKFMSVIFLRNADQERFE